MQIVPTNKDFEIWTSFVPTDGDLIFLSEEKSTLFLDLPFTVQTRAQVKAQGLELWTLDRRSWYGYALEGSDYCVFMPSGALEALDAAFGGEIFTEQKRLEVPTVLGDSWMTSAKWKSLSIKDKIFEMQRWAVQNGIQYYESIDFDQLPLVARSELARIGYDKLINRFSGFSGPNCFAAVAGAILDRNRNEVTQKWLHWAPFEKILSEQDFAITTSLAPETGDVLIFTNNKVPVHAAYFIGDGFYFEKPGQDFYEPYRVAKFQDWPADWPDSELSIWRRKTF